MSPLWFLIILFGGIALAWLLFRLFFSMKSTQAIIDANAETNKGKYYIKKYPEADVFKFSSSFTLVGFLIALGFCAFAFNWYQKPPEVVDLGPVEMIDETEQLPPQSMQKPPPPPPPPPPPKLEVVEDEEVIEDEPEIMDMEADEETVVEDIPEIVEEVAEEVVEEVVEEPVKEVVEEPEIFTIVEEMPNFPGGQAELFKFIGKNIDYPAMARENGIEGTVYVGFVVMENGSIQNVEIKRGLPGGGAGCDAAAINVVKKMPKWNPGKQRGKPVRVAFTLPVKFKLE